MGYLQWMVSYPTCTLSERPFYCALALCAGIKASGTSLFAFAEYRDNDERVASALSVSTNLFGLYSVWTILGLHWPYKLQPFDSVYTSSTCHSVYACTSQVVSVPPFFTLKPFSATHICYMPSLCWSFVVTEYKHRSSTLCAACMNTWAITFTWREYYSRKSLPKSRFRLRVSANWVGQIGTNDRPHLPNYCRSWWDSGSSGLWPNYDGQGHQHVVWPYRWFQTDIMRFIG
jgi:hypothetical protein